MLFIKDELLSKEETYKAKKFLKIWEVLSWFSVVVVVAMLIFRPTFPYGPKEMWIALVTVRTVWMVGYYHILSEKYRLQINFVIIETFIFILFAFFVIYIAGGVVTDRYYILITVLFFLAIGYNARLIWPAAIFILVLSVGSFITDGRQMEGAIARPTTTAMKLLMPLLVAYIGTYLAKEAYEQRKAKEELQRLEHDRQNFINASAHVLRTPITAIVGIVEILEQEELTGKSKEYVEWISENINSLSSVVEELLIISRIENGDTSSLNDKVNVVHSLNTVLDSYKNRLKNKHITVTRSFGESAQYILADATLLTRVLKNIIDNAVKFTPQNKSIYVSVHEMGSTVEVIIADKGIGMSLTFTDKLYEKFRRELDALDQQYVGAGLGLYTSKLIMGSLGGTMKIETHKGKGTTVTLSFPKFDGHNLHE